MKIAQHQQGPLLGRQGVETGQGRHRVPGGLATAVWGTAQAINEVPAQQGAAAESLGGLFQQAINPFLLKAADPQNRRAGPDQ